MLSRVRSEKSGRMVSFYVSKNPLWRAIIETLVMTLIAVAHFLLFAFALEDRFDKLFPISETAFTVFVPIMLVTLFTNHIERLMRFNAMSVARDSGDEETYKILSYREERVGAGMRGFAVFTVYVFLVAFPWLLWGRYWWLSIAVYFFTAAVLLGFLRYSCSYPMKLENDQTHYFKKRA